MCHSYKKYQTFHEMNLERSENLKYSRVNKGIHICLYRNCHLIVSEREDRSNKGVMCWEVEVGWLPRGEGWCTDSTERQRRRRHLGVIWRGWMKREIWSNNVGKVSLGARSHTTLILNTGTFPPESISSRNPNWRR